MLTKEQWQEIEIQLSGSFGRVELLCDGYKVNAEVHRRSALKYVVVVFVNGICKGEWMKDEAEESKKFYCAKKHYLYKPAARQEAKQKLKSRRLHASIKDFYKSVAEAATVIWLPYWTDPKAFCRQLRKTCTSIEVVKIGYGQ